MSADKHVTIVVWVVMAVALFIALGPAAHAGRFVLYSMELLYDNEVVSAIGRFAVDNRLTTNYYRVGRYSKDVAYEEAVQTLEKGFDKDTMYIFSMDDFDNEMTEELYYYNIGNKYIIGVVED